MAWQIQQSHCSSDSRQHNGHSYGLMTQPAFLDSLTDLASPHVLIMDEALEVLDVLGARLHDEGYSVTMVTGLLRPEEIRRLNPDLIVMDLKNRKSAYGRKLVRAIEKDPVIGGIPVVCCTTDRSARRERRLLAATVPVEPFDVEEVLASIRREIGSPPVATRRTA
jgi:CheY-like chemotaxis protein